MTFSASMALTQITNKIFPADLNSGEVCPELPADAKGAVQELLGIGLGGIIVGFFVGALISIALLAIGRAANSRMATGAGTVGLVVLLVGVVLYLIFPGILAQLLGSGCVDVPKMG